LLNLGSFLSVRRSVSAFQTANLKRLMDSAGDGSFQLAGVSHHNSPPSFQIESQLPETAHNAVAKVNVKLESKQKTMKPKHLFIALAALLAAGGLWLGRTAWRTHAFHKSSTGAGLKTPDGQPTPGQMLRPPDPNRRFRELTPEERVRLARQGPIGG
jgi:hypothetical protein